MPLSNDGTEVVDDSEITISYDADANQTLVEFDYNNIIEGRHKFEISGENHRVPISFIPV